jgi:putative Holliday junction resolvase
MARSLGLDVGNRRIGAAVSDATKLIARPLGMIDRKHEDALARIAAWVREQQVDEIVIGLPYHADGKLSSQAQQVQQFAGLLQAHVAVPITFVDERYTTQDAKAIIAEARRSKQPQHDDAVAAAVILQRHLDAQRHDNAADEFEFDE